MTKNLPRRDFFKSAAVATVAASVTSAWVRFISAPEISTKSTEAPRLGGIWNER